MRVLKALLVTMIAVSAYGVDITVDAESVNCEVSPYIYGKNNMLISWDDSTWGEENLQLHREAGVRYLREGEGNNSTKYNWRNGLSSHPDYYNNVYEHNWDEQASIILSEMDGVDALFSLQVLGYAAKAGGDEFNSTTSDAADGDWTKYLVEWPADSTVGILDHWFGGDGLGYDKSRLQYWSLDNEPEIWQSTHDDVMSEPLSAEECVQKYLDVAKAAKEVDPEIKLTGPVFTNEWQWWTWPGSEDGFVDGMPWMEYFIKRFAEESEAFGQNLIDVIDFHSYPDYDGTETGAAGDETLAQMHRMWFDSTYDYPQANGCKLWPDGNWDESQEKEMAFRRVNNWLDKYFGEGHGITLALTECGFFEENGDPSADVIAVWYASHLGTFAEHNVSIFTPWSWYTGMWEVMNLFSHNAKEISVSSETSDKTAVTGFTTLSRNRDSLTLILVNHTTEKQNADVSLDGFEASDGEYTVLQLSDLPESETFVSHSDNALEESSVSLVSNSFAMDLPGYSVTAVLLSGSGSSVANAAEFYKERGYSLSTTGRGVISLAMDKRAEIEVDLYNIAGRHVQSLYKGVPETGVAELKPGVESGVYCIRVKNQTGVVVSEKIVLTR